MDRTDHEIGDGAISLLNARLKKPPGEDLLFPPGKDAREIEDKVRDQLRQALDDVLASDRCSKHQIGRILIHGIKPHLTWSKAEGYRPIYFSFGQICGRCIDCLKGTRRRKTGAGAYNIVSEYWKDQCKTLLKRGTLRDCVPACWPDSYLITPEIRPCEKGQLSTFGHWTLRDILVLSRMRLRRWAIRKREIVQSKALSLSEAGDSLALYTDHDFRHNGSDIVSVLLAARKASVQLDRDWRNCNGKPPSRRRASFVEQMQRYVATFESDAWGASHVWKDGWPPICPEWNPEKPMGAISSREAWQIVGSPLWDKKTDKRERERYEWLNTQLAAFCPNVTTPQALYGWMAPDDHVFIYCELSPQLQAAIKRAKRLRGDTFGRLPKERRRMMKSLCGSALLPWQRAFRDADARWGNHKALSSVFPADMQTTLLVPVKKIPKELSRLTETPEKECRPRSVLESVQLARVLYSKRVWQEEDTPVNLALATMGDMWRFVFPGVVEPEYAEFQRAQQFMRSIPGYRDHLTHSVQVFLLGYKIVDELFHGEGHPGKLYDRYQMFAPHDWTDYSRYCEIIAAKDYQAFTFQWALASLMHDFAIPAERANDLVGHLFSTFLGVKAETQSGTNGLRDVLEDEKRARTLIYGVLSKTSAGAKVLGADMPPVVGEFALHKLAEDHGFLSALYLFTQLFEGVGKPVAWWRLKRPVEKLILSRVLGLDDVEVEGEYKKGHTSPYGNVAEALVLEVLDAVIKHNAFAKEHRFGFQRKLLGTNFRFPSDLSAADNSLLNSPIPGLLFLCDTLCDWGRVIHPDELNRHEPRGVTHSTPDKTERPENVVTKIDGRKIEIDYRWRVPFGHSGNGHCLFPVWGSVRQEMWPYAPPVGLPEICSDCRKRHGSCKGRTLIDNCAMFATIQSFWEDVLLLGKPNCRLRFPKLHTEFNGLRLSIFVPGPNPRKARLEEELGLPVAQASTRCSQTSEASCNRSS